MNRGSPMSARNFARRRAAVMAVVGRARFRPVAERVEAYAPANIALCKYWGKRDAALNLPTNGSVSVSLATHGTITEVRPASGDEFCLNGAPLAPDSPAGLRLKEYLDLFRSAECPAFAVKTENTIPTAAGLASSASAYAALARALDALFGWNLSPRRLSILARLGSGSAARSAADGFVEWRRGQRADGMDSFAVRWPVEWPKLRIGLMLVTSEPKAVGSREGMRHTVETSPLYAAWPAAAERDLRTLRAAARVRDFTRLGEIAEANAMAMHATMIAARPALRYWRPATLAVLDRVAELRAAGVEVYATLDAGPNVKLLFQAADEASVRFAFPELLVVNPFGTYKIPSLTSF